MLWEEGTALTRGSGLGVVVAIGLSTELGQISQLVETAEPGSSPLEKKLGELAAQLVWATLIVCAAIAGIGLYTGKDPLPDRRGGNCARCGGHPRRLADRRYDRAGTRHVAHGEAKCPH